VLTRLRAALTRIGLWPLFDSRYRPDPPDPGRGVDPDDLVMLANDLRNLLTIMMRGVEVARKHVEQQRWAMADFIAVEHVADRADRMILRLMSGEPGAYPLRQAVDVNVICAECHGMLLCAVGTAVQLNVQLTASRVFVRADLAEIERILLNLALGARHAMPDGGVLTIRTSSLTEVPPGLRNPHVRAKPYVRITVSDTGSGMPSGMRARVLDRAPLRKTHGTELGLASVAHTVRLLGGALDIDSDGASGTHVTVDLPCVERSQTPAG